MMYNLYDEIIEDNQKINELNNTVENAMDNLVALHGLRSLVKDSKDTVEAKRLSLYALESSKCFLGEAQMTELKASVEDYDTMSMEGIASAIGDFIAKVFSTTIKIIKYIFKSIWGLIKKILIFLGLMSEKKKKTEKKLEKVVEEVKKGTIKPSAVFTKEDMEYLNKNFGARLLKNNDITSLYTTPSINVNGARDALGSLTKLLESLMAAIDNGWKLDKPNLKGFVNIDKVEPHLKSGILKQVKNTSNINKNGISVFEMYDHKQMSTAYHITDSTSSKFSYASFLVNAAVDKKVTKVKDVKFSDLLSIYASEFSGYSKRVADKLTGETKDWEGILLSYLSDSQKRLEDFENKADKDKDLGIKEILLSVKGISVVSSKALQGMFLTVAKEEKELVNLIDAVFLKTDTSNIGSDKKDDKSSKERFKKRQAKRKGARNSIDGEITPYDITF